MKLTPIAANQTKLLSTTEHKSSLVIEHQLQHICQAKVMLEHHNSGQ